NTITLTIDYFINYVKHKIIEKFNEIFNERSVYFMESIKNMNYLNKENHLEFYELLFNALADKVRLKIINEISNSINKSLCVCDLEEKLNLKQSKISYHLKKLVNANILNIEKHGTWNYYKINEKQIQVILT